MLRRAGGRRVSRRAARAGAGERRVLRRGVPRARRARRDGGEFHGRRSPLRPVPAAHRKLVRRLGGGDARALRPEHHRLRAEGRAAADGLGRAARAGGAAGSAAAAAVPEVSFPPARHEPVHGLRAGDPSVSWDVLILAAVGFAGAFVFGITGFGIALVTIPLATQLVPLKFALALYAIMDLA